MAKPALVKPDIDTESQDSSWPDYSSKKAKNEILTPLSTFYLIDARGNTSEMLSEKVSERNFYGVEGTAYTPTALPPTLSTPPRLSLSSRQNLSLFLASPLQTADQSFVMPDRSV
jgi:hypothetical protein